MTCSKDMCMSLRLLRKHKDSQHCKVIQTWLKIAQKRGKILKNPGPNHEELWTREVRDVLPFRCVFMFTPSPYS